MNNLNDPPRWNIQPNPGEREDGGADGNQWNYALLVPMLGLAAFRWIWTRESEREIEKAKSKYKRDVFMVKSEMESRYEETLTERRKAVASLEVELEKERERVKGYKHAMISQSHHLVEERKRLQEERDWLEEQKQSYINSGAGAAVLHQAMDQQNKWYQRANATLQEVEAQLVERQDAYCSLLLPRDKRLEMERNILVKVVKEPLAEEIDLEADLREIFKRDKHCANLMNMDKRKNGSLMWVYLKNWQLQVTVEKHKRTEAAILGKNLKPDTK
ncbi:coiled-coil domain-containing protein 127-like [Stigmatopora nigra]